MRNVIRSVQINGLAGLFAGLLLTGLSGCSSLPERAPLPPDLTLKAEITGVPEARFWGDE